MKTHRTIPVFRRKENAAKISHALFKLRLYHDGVPLPANETAIARLMDSTLTQKEKTYLEHYYLDKLTHRAIAKRLSVDHTTVSKGIMRAEGKIEPFMELITNPYIDN